MKEKIIKLLGLESYAHDKKVAKNIFYAEDDFSKHAEKIFTKDVDAISLISVLATSNTNMPIYSTDEEIYPEIYVIHMTIRNKQSIEKISSIIHQIVQQPLLLIIQHESKVCLTISQKRRNKADKSKQVIENLYTSDRINTDEHTAFRTDMHYTSHIFTNLKRFYEGRLYPIVIMQYQHLWGGYRSIALAIMPEIYITIQDYQLLQKQIEPLEHAYKQTVSMGEQTKLYMQIKKLKEQQQAIISTL